MRTRLLLLLLSLALLGAACGGGDDGGDDAADDTTATTASDDSGDDGGDDEASGDVDCPEVRDALEQLGLDVQVMAQLRTQAQYDLIARGTIELDADVTLAAIEVARALEVIEVEGTLGTVEESLDLYEEAALLAKANLAVDDPFAEAQGEELAALTADLGAFLGAQAPVNAAFDAAGCV